MVSGLVKIAACVFSFSNINTTTALKIPRLTTLDQKISYFEINDLFVVEAIKDQLNKHERESSIEQFAFEHLVYYYPYIDQAPYHVQVRIALNKERAELALDLIQQAAALEPVISLVEPEAVNQYCRDIVNLALFTRDSTDRCALINLGRRMIMNERTKALITDDALLLSLKFINQENLPLYDSEEYIFGSSDIVK
jgi:hypothetical protein